MAKRAKELKTLWVKGTGKVDNKVLLWEKHESHPDGEVMVVNDGKAYEVAETAGVSRLMGERRLVEAEEQEGWSDAKKQRATDAPSAPLRPATDQEEDAAGLTTPVEKETARVPIEGGIRRGNRP